MSIDHIRTDQKHDLISMNANNDDISDGIVEWVDRLEIKFNSCM